MPPPPMATNLQENIQRYQVFFDQITELLAKKPWFKKEKWIAQPHLFEINGKAEAVSFHLFKKTWFNEDRQGIHFETFRDLRLGKDKEVVLTLHLFHTKNIPGTKLKREAVSKIFVDRSEKTIKSWNGYKFRTGKYGTQYFSKSFKVSDKDLHRSVADEFEKLCTVLGPEIDRALKEVLSK